MIAYLKLPIEVSHQTKCGFRMFVTTLNLFWVFRMTYIPKSMKHIKEKKWSPTNDVKNNHRYQHSHDLRELKEGESKYATLPTDYLFISIYINVVINN